MLSCMILLLIVLASLTIVIVTQEDNSVGSLPTCNQLLEPNGQQQIRAVSCYRDSMWILYGGKPLRDIALASAKNIPFQKLFPTISERFVPMIHQPSMVRLNKEETIFSWNGANRMHLKLYNMKENIYHRIGFLHDVFTHFTQIIYSTGEPMEDVSTKWLSFDEKNPSLYNIKLSHPNADVCNSSVYYRAYIGFSKDFSKLFLSSEIQRLRNMSDFVPFGKFFTADTIVIFRYRAYVYMLNTHNGSIYYCKYFQFHKANPKYHIEFIPLMQLAFHQMFNCDPSATESDTNLFVAIGIKNLFYITFALVWLLVLISVTVLVIMVKLRKDRELIVKQLLIREMAEKSICENYNQDEAAADLDLNRHVPSL